MLVIDKLTTLVSHHWIVNSAVVYWSQEDVGQWAFTSDYNFMILLSEV